MELELGEVKGGAPNDKNSDSFPSLLFLAFCSLLSTK